MKRLEHIQWSSALLLWLLVLGVVLGACSADTSFNESTLFDHSASSPAQKGTADKDRGDTSLRAAAAKAMQQEAPETYSAMPEAAGRYSLANAAQRMTAIADRSGLLLRANESAASFSLRTSGYGCEGAMRQVEAREPLVEKNRIAYARPELGMDEWYLNGPLGVEQGFSIAEAPNCTGTKVITMEALGDVIPALEDADGDGRGDNVRLVADHGEPGFWVRDLAVVDASGKTLSAWMTVEAGVIAIHFDDAGAVYPVEVDPLIGTQEQKLIALDGAASDYFGYSVALSGDTAIVGAIYDDDAGPNSGSAYVFVRNAGVWALQAKLTASDGAAGDEFGVAIALSGDTAIVGAYLANTGQGSAYVFVRDPMTLQWSQQQKLTAMDGAAGDYFGSSVALSGDTAFVGAYHDDDNGTDSGSAYVFKRNPMMPVGMQWSQQQKLTAGDGAQYDYFGYAVSLSGDTAIVGAYEDDDQGTDSGSAYVFKRNPMTMVWSQEQKLIAANDGTEYDKFGISVAIDGDTAIVGAYLKGLDDSGAAYVFTRSGVTWTEQAELMASDGAATDQFGWAVALSGDTAIIGANFDDTKQGSAYVFTRSGVTWTQQQKLTGSAGAAKDEFGISVALEGDTAFVGAFKQDIGVADSGSAYVFTRSGVTWTQAQKLTASDGALSDGAASDYFGYSVAIDGDTAIVGAYLDDDKGVGSGSAYAFVRSAGVWAPQAKLTASDGAAGDHFGDSVALSGDTAIVGAPSDDNVGSDSGSVHIFTRNAGVWTQQPKLTASDGAAGDRFGISVALSGDTALVGAFWDDDKGTESGSAYIFVRNAGVWTEQAKLTASDGAAGGVFGSSVALSGDTAFVGAYLDDIAANPGQGSAYVFTRGGVTWTQQQKLTASDGAAGDEFGVSIALSGDTALVGAGSDNIAANPGQGSAYVFTRSGVTWTEQTKLTASDGAAGDHFGDSVAISGDTAIVGAWADDVGANGYQGSAYVFARIGVIWTEQAKLTASDGATNDFLGISVALSGDTAFVGAFTADIGANADQGSAYVFVLRKTNGETCAASTECVSGFCDPTGNVCACDEDADCPMGQLCNMVPNPNACAIPDFDSDGLTDADEIMLGTDPNDADSDDDGALDGAEANTYTTDPNNADSDNDGVTDGTELGLDCSNPDTDQAAGVCIADADSGATTTNPLDTDTDNGGVPDGTEDANHNGQIDAGETDPNNLADDKKPNGQPCAAASQCLSNFCTDGVCCQVSTCAALDQCHDAGTCQPATGTCSDPAKADATKCTAADGTTGACQAGTCFTNVPPLIPCSTDSQCPELFACIKGKCQPVTKGPLDSVAACACSLPGNTAPRPPTALLLVALSALFARRKRSLPHRP